MVARKRDFIPPVIREIAAFLGEHVLLSYLKQTNHSAYAATFFEWKRQNNLYLGLDVQALKVALEHPDSGYNYRHNYPLARILAVQLFRSVDHKKLWPVFQGKWTVTDCIKTIKFSN